MSKNGCNENSKIKLTISKYMNTRSFNSVTVVFKVSVILTESPSGADNEKEGGENRYYCVIMG